MSGWTPSAHSGEPAAHAETIPTPGAVIVGSFRYVHSVPSGIVNVAPSPSTPREEKSARVAPSLLPAATETTHGAWAYGLCVSAPGPSFPAANKTEIPRWYARYVAWTMGWAGSKSPLDPHELVTTRMP